MKSSLARVLASAQNASRSASDTAPGSAVAAASGRADASSRRWGAVLSLMSPIVHPCPVLDQGRPRQVEPPQRLEVRVDEIIDRGVQVGRLRRKIETDPEHPRHLLTKTGIGYLFAAPDCPRPA